MQLLVACAAMLVGTAGPGQAMMFSVHGSGILAPDSQIGMPGEHITFSFTYEDSLFGQPIEVIPGNPNFINYEATTPFMVSVTGSISGPFSVDPIRFANPNNYTFDQWNYLSGINGLIQTNNTGGAALSAPFPAAFADINAMFVNQVNTTNLWQHSSNLSFGLDNTVSPGATLMLTNANWTVQPVPAPVPEPSTWMLLGTGLVGLVLYGWRKRKQTA
jgi:hypothetical protein